MLATSALGCMAAGSRSAEDVIDWRSAKPLTLESLGSPVGRVSVKALDQFSVPGKADSIQLIWYQAASKEGLVTQIASLNLTSGEMKVHPSYPGWDVWRTVWAGDRLYLGMVPPGHLVEYDQANDSLIDRGNPFDKTTSIFCLAGGPDGTVAIGAAGSTEVTLYDPRTRKFQKFGEIGRSGAGSVYYISQDDRFIYAVPRGQCPWDLIAIEKATGKRTTLITKPHEGYIDVQGPNVRVTNHFRKEGVPTEDFVLQNGKLAAPGTKAARSHRTASGDPYEVVIDQRAATATGKINVLFRRAKSPGSVANANPWTSRSLTVGIQASALTRIMQIGPALIAGTTGGYGAMFTYDIARNATRLLGFPAGMNPYSIAWIEGKAYVSGYPSTRFAVADLNRPFTHNEATADGPGVPWEDVRANPRLIASLGTVLEGSHTGIGIFPGADGRVYVVGQRHRHYRGFGVAYYDPKTGKFGEVDSGGMTQQTQISWVTPIDNGQRLAISTRVQPDDNKTAPPPKDARLFILDTRSGTFTRQISPLPGVQALGPIAESEGFLIGTAANPANAESGPSTLYKLDLRTGKTVLTRTYQGLICGVSANHDAPSKSYDFITGPDGKIWTMFLLPYADSPDLLMRIRPSDLGVETLGTLKGEVRFLFVGNDLYLTGANVLRRLRNATSMR